MAKVKCKLVSIYAKKSESRKLLERLQEMAVMDIETAAGDEVTSTSPQGYSKKDTASNIDIYERSAIAAENALKILNERYPEKKGLLAAFSGTPDVTREEFYLDKEKSNTIRTLAGDIINYDRFIAEQKAEILRLKTGIDQLSIWLPLDVPLSFKGTAKTTAFIGTVAGNYTLEELLTALAKADPKLLIYAEIVNTDKDNTYIFASCPKEYEEAAEQALRTLSFARPSQNTSRLPQKKIDSRLLRIKECEKKIEEYNEKLKLASKSRNDLELFYDFCKSKAEHYRTLGEIDRTANTTLIRGYVAQPDIDFLKESLEKEFTVVIETEEPNEELAPVKLKNNWFSAPAETITTMYSLPSSKDIDPTPLTGFFYYLLFGMMLSDAGYGLLIVVGTLLILKFLNPSQKMRNTFKMFLYCGISTVFWGLIFGSFFGDSIAVISETFFGKRVVMPALLEPMNGDAVTLLILSLVIGFIQIIAGLAAKFVTCIKNGDKAAAFFDAGLWITTLFGIGMLAVGIFALPILKTIGAVVAIVSVIGLILTQGRDKKGPMRILSGIASLYDITGYVSDLLSFSRLMALGLTTGAMAAVFNMLGAMAGGGILGAFLMIVMFVIGHALCFALNALGAYVHTLRLQYVELFSKFYEGGGREFKAFSLKNKYFGVKNTEKEEN
ncbi:MAG: V-type ATP synthase subunit I [Ruminococcaceae bacterium]|nr:V-type ATP synthase subunit I [Oscillospiraceae bacterium]